MPSKSSKGQSTPGPVSDNDRLRDLLLALWIGFSVLSWVLVTLGGFLSEVTGIRINTEAMDRFGYLWLAICVSGAVWGALSALKRDSSRAG